GQSRGGPSKQRRHCIRIPTNHLRAAESMVESDQDVRDDETTLRQVRPVVGKRNGRFQARGVVIGEITDDRLSTSLCLGEVAKVRAATDERVSPEPSAFYRLEQEGHASFAAQPQVGAEGGDEVGGDVGCDGYLEFSIEWTGTQKDPPVEGLDERNGLSWTTSVQAQDPDQLATQGPDESRGSHSGYRVGAVHRRE